MRKCWLTLLTATALISCTSEGQPEPASPDASVIPPCTDADGDGFGLGCAAGLDCDDTNRASTNECFACADSNTGCACDGSVADQPCYLDPVDVGGRPMCHEGTRFCRDGAWTACLQLTARELPGSVSGGSRAALVTGPVACNPCNPSCYSTTDTPGPGDVGPSVVYAPVPGGITLPGSTSTPALVDTDGDGVPDAYEAEFALTGGFFHVLPLGATALDPLPLSVQIRTADIYFLMDTTATMGGEIANLSAALAGTLIPSIRTAIPDAWFGVGDLEDYPVWPYGYSSNHPYVNRQSITSSIALNQAAVAALRIDGNNYVPTSATQALYSIATGSGLGPYYPAQTACPAGTWGYPCFRDGTVPIVVLFTDAGYHNGTIARDDYDPADFGTTFTYYALPAAVAVVATAGHWIALPGSATAAGTTPLPDTWASAKDVGDVTSTSVSYSGSTATVGMTSNYSASCGGAGAKDAVFWFRLAAPARLQIDTNGSTGLTDSVLSIWTRPASGSPVEQFCDDDSGTGALSLIDTGTPLASGDYYVVVDGYDSSSPTGAYKLNIKPYVAGTYETFETAYPIGDVTSRSAKFTGSTAAMASEYSGWCNSGSGGDAVFSFTLTSPRAVEIDTIGSGFDTSLTLWSSDFTGGWCNDDLGGGVRQSRVSRYLAAGTYFVVVDGYGSNSGSYVLNLKVSNSASGGFLPPTYLQAIAALNARNIKVIVVESSDVRAADHADTVNDANALCTATSTIHSGTLAPMVYTIASDGTGLDTRVVTAIQDIANYNRMDISARANDNPATPFNESTLVSSFTAVSFGPGNCNSFGAGRFVQCTPGTTVNFQVNYTGVVAATAVIQRFDFTIDVLGDGTAILATIPVTIIIPPIAPAFPASGTYFRDYDATASCAGTEVPRWGALSWSGTFPPGTNITWSLQSAATAAGLGAATPVSTTVTDSAPPLAAWNTGDALLAAAKPATLPFMRVTATLNSDAARSAAPTLSSFEILFDCLPGT
jgi:hypothetical protein